MEVQPSSTAELEAFGKEHVSQNNLLTLLHWMFTQACEDLTNLQSDIKTISSRLRFISRCADNSASAVLSQDAQALYARLYTAHHTSGGLEHRLFAPKFDPELYLKELVLEMKRCESITIDAAAERTQAELLQKLDEKEDKTTNILKGLASVAETSSFDPEAEQDAVDRAADVEVKLQELKNRQSEAFAAQEELKLQMNIREYQLKEEVIQEMVVLGIQLGVSVAATIASSGTAAPATVKVCLDIANKTYEAAGTFSKIFYYVKAFAKIAATITTKVVSAFKKYSNANQLGVDVKTKTEKAISSSPTASADASLDFIGLMADWDDYEINVRNLFNGLDEAYKGQTAVINALNDYKAAMEKVIVRGRATVAAFKESAIAAAKVRQQTAEKAARKLRSEELIALGEAMSNTKDQDLRAHNMEMAKFLVDKELAARRRTLFVQFYRALLAYMYRTNTGRFPLEFRNEKKKGEQSDVKKNDDGYGLSPERDIKIFRKRYDDLEKILLGDGGAKTIFGTGQSQTFRDKVSSSCMSPQWQQLLQSEARIPFTIPETALPGHHSTRVQTVCATFHIAHPSNGTIAKKFVPHAFVFGPLMQDRTPSRKMFKYWTDPQILDKKWPDSEWTFEHSKIIPPTLFSSGTLKVTKAALAEAKVDPSQIVDITIAIKGYAVAYGD